ncbi:hypothetical protein Q3G72_005165 [Acer saccharum]|nr:hypothetical protein Q3G72_005165 [Acer saccharum]
MAFSSKPPASSKDVSMPPMPVSSGSLSASLYPPGSQKESSAASSQSTKGKKRNRGDGHGISSQRRRSTRNPRIGLGFRNEPDNPVQIVDNDEVTVVGDKGREWTGDILPADSSEILVEPLLPFGEGRIIPDSVCTDDTLARLRKCEIDSEENEPSFDDFRYIFQVTSMVPRGQFYLRPKNKLQFVVPGANVKFTSPWKNEWVVVEGDWGQSVCLDGVKCSVPIRFSPQEKWNSGELSAESSQILLKIQDRGYANSQYPTCDPFEGARLERHLWIPLAQPGFQVYPGHGAASDFPVGGQPGLTGPTRGGQE